MPTFTVIGTYPETGEVYADWIEAASAPDAIRNVQTARWDSAVIATVEGERDVFTHQDVTDQQTGQIEEIPA